MAETSAPDAIYQLPLQRIFPSTHQARRIFNERSLRALAESLGHEGLIQPIVVREAKNGYELISGERRWRAAKMLGWETIAARIIPVVSEGEAAAKGLVENLQRKNLNPIEEADGFAELNRADPHYWTHDRIAQICGKDRTYVTRSFKLLMLPRAIVDRVRQGAISRNHAIELARLTDPEKQQGLLDKILVDNLTVAETRAQADRLLGNAPKRRALFSEDSLADGDGMNDPLIEEWKTIVAHPALESQDLKPRYLGNERWAFISPALGERSHPRDVRNAIADWLARLSDVIKHRG